MPAAVRPQNIRLDRLVNLALRRHEDVADYELVVLFVARMKPEISREFTCVFAIAANQA
jgi:hypothetical protein